MPNAVKTDRHNPKRTNRPSDRHRGSASSRGYGVVWRRAARRHLKRNPICVGCFRKNIIEPARVVDHIQPHAGNSERFWDVNNWQALCIRCHNRKTAR